MDMPKGVKSIRPAEVDSRAECLLLMDKLMRHLSDEEDMVGWLVNGVPDGGPALNPTEEQMDYYRDYVDDFEEHVRLFAKIVRRVCFRTRYEPGGLC